ncbi:MAG: WYL domain-containing protein [Pseudomonadota bacterium]
MDEKQLQSFNEQVREMSRAQLERLAYIDFRLYFLGELRRNDLIERFGTGPAGATRDIAMYKQIAPNNLELDGSSKIYFATRQFEPVFEHEPERVLTALSRGFGEGLEVGDALVRSETPFALNTPKMAVLAPISQAIHRKKAIRLIYHSVSSGTGSREIVPFGLVSNGVRWHVRAYDRKTADFRDFVFTRMETPEILEDSIVERVETFEFDAQWSRVVVLDLVVHPDHPRPDVVRRDYTMAEGVLKVRVRATNLGYLLQLWRVDCSPNHCLRALEYPLWLRDSLCLHGVENALLAPGYVSPLERLT